MDKLQSPLISVIMSVYNTKSTFLEEAIDSVLRQTYSNFEFIIVDDASNSETKRILNKYRVDERVRIIENEANKGLTINLNIAMAHSRGKYLARMDSDDICDIYRFEKQVAFLEANDSIDVLGTGYSILCNGTNKRQYIEGKNTAQIQASLFFGNSCIVHSSVMLRACKFNTISGLCYDETFKKSQDYDLWSRSCSTCGFAVLDEPLMVYRISEDQISQRASSEQIELRNRVILSNLNLLIDNYSHEDSKLHLHLCNSEKVSSSQRLIMWCNELVTRNRKKSVFDRVSFEFYLFRREIRCLIKSSQSVRDYFSSIPILGRFIRAKCLFIISRNK